MSHYLPTLGKRHYVPLLLALAVYLGSLLFSSYDGGPVGVVADSAYAGSPACRACHRAIYDSFVSTAHNRASALASAETVIGHVDSGRNSFKFNQLSSVLLGVESGSFFQAASLGGAEYKRAPMDIVVGSGRKGQTYLYWKDNVLLQDPISYYTPADCWCNSPGYPKNGPYFDRVTNARCLECHASHALAQDGSTNDIAYFQKSSILYGINCERCHGPSEAHVLFHTAHPDEKAARLILTKNESTRQQKLDVCGLCHSGIRTSVKAPFSFIAGDRLSDYSAVKYDPDSAALLDVHGNQYGLLTSSKCFVNSQMTCSSCHNVHQTEIAQPRVYSARCMTCHNPSSHNECTVKEVPGLVLSNNCIDCHMPLLPSKAIYLQLENSRLSTPDFVRTHRVAIYPKVSSEFLRKLAKASR
jgi:hypothetical protein